MRGIESRRKPAATRYLSGAALVLAAAITPAVGGQPAADLAPSDRAWSPAPLAESGKPMLVPPAPLPLQTTEPRCLPALPCGTRLLGTVRKNGAVELQVPAWRW